MSKVNKNASRSAAKGLATKTKKTKDYSSFRTYLRDIVKKSVQSHTDPRVQMSEEVAHKFNAIIRNIVNDLVANAYEVANLRNMKTIDAHAVWCAFKRLYPDAAAKTRPSFESLMATRARKHKTAKPAEEDAPKAPKPKRVRKERKGKAAPVEPEANVEEENSE